MSDDKGRLSIFQGIDQKDDVKMRLVKTDYKRLKSLRASPDGSFLTVLTDSSIAIWSAADLKEAFEEGKNDLMRRLEPTKEIPTTQRLLCSTVTVIRDEVVKVRKVKASKEAPKVNEKQAAGKS